MDNSPNLNLPYIAPAQSQKHVTHNEALRLLDILVQAMVLDRTLTSTPSSPTNGQRYIVGPSATGIWAGQSNAIAAYQDGSWVYLAPQIGWLVWVANEAKLISWSGTAWILAGDPGVNPVALVGINTIADTINRLAIKSDASLFDNAGAGHQSKINKAAAANTASTLFQTAYSGRAELGLTGDDNFHIKVSADGSTWTEAIVIDRTTGAVTFPHTSVAANSAFGASGSAHASGLVPDPGPITGAAKFLREDGTWSNVPPGVNASDVGYDVILITGQSNAVGSGATFDASFDFTDSRIMQFGSSGTYTNNIITAVDPLLHASPISSRIGFPMTFAKLYAASVPTNRKVLLVPCAVSGTGFTTGTSPYDWTAGSPGGALYETAIRQANLAIAAAGPNARFVGVLWHQGEADTSMSATTYAAALDALIAGFRARITGASNSWFLLGRLTPDNVAASSIYQTIIDPAHLATPARNARCAVFSGEPGYVNNLSTDYIHYNALGQRFMGLSAFNALPTALANTAGVSNPAVPAQVTGLTAGTAGGPFMPISWTALGTAPLDYIVQYKASSSSTWITWQRNISLAPSTTVTGLSGLTSYDFRIAAVNSSGIGAWSSTLTVSTIASNMLDTLSATVNSAYSVRLLRTGYAGAAIRVRRSSDNTELDIGFVASGNNFVLDTASLLTFAGSGPAYVKTWYDQKNSNNATQTDTTKQPRIVNAGVLDTINSIAMPRWVAAAGLFAATGHPTGADFASFGVFASTGSGVNIMSNNGAYLWQNSGNFQYYDATSPANVAMSAGVLHAGGVTFVYSSRSAKVYLDAATGGPTTTAGYPTNTGFGIGCYESTGASSSMTNGYIGEAVLFGSVPGSTDIAAVLLSQKTYFGTP